MNPASAPPARILHLSSPRSGPAAAARRSGRAPRLLGITAAVFLVIAGLLGGAGNSYPVVGGLIQGLGLLLLLHVLVVSARRRVPSGVALPVAIGLLALLLPLAQLVPLPPAWWGALPSGGSAAPLLAAAGIPLGWRPLSLDPVLTEMTLLELVPGLALFWSALLIDDAGRRRLLAIAVGLAVLSAILGALQMAAGGQSGLLPFATAHGNNAPGLFVNRNHQACFLLAAMPQLAGLFRARRLRSAEAVPGQSAILLALLALLGAGAIATTSRMGLLLLAPATLGALAIAFGIGGTRRHVAGALALAGVAAAVVAGSSAFRVAFARLGVDEDSRSLYWAATRGAIAHFWPLGTGLGTFARVYPTVERLDTLEKAFPYNAHEDYLELLLEGGAPALLLLLAALAFLVVAGLRLVRRPQSRSAAIGMGAWCGLVLILLHSLVDYPLRMMSVMATFGLLAGVVAASSAGDKTGGTARRGRSGIAIAGAVLLGGGVLAALYRTVMLAAAQHALLADDYRAAAARAPGWSDASATVAQQDLRAKRLGPARALAMRAIASSPLDPQGTLALLLVDRADGRQRAADRLLDTAPRFGWRPVPLQYLLAFRAADRGDLAGAVPHADALLRQDLYRETFYPFLRAAAAYPDGLGALAARLANAPPWRRSYLGAPTDLQPADHPAHEAVLKALRHTRQPPTPDEVNAYLRQVASSGDYGAAAAAARRLSPPDPAGALLHDPSFRQFRVSPLSPNPFDWQAVELPGVALERSPAGLHLDAEDRASGVVLRQVLVLPPGAYRLAWWAPSDQREQAGGLAWAVRCVGGGYLAGRADRRIVVPATGCAAQQLELSLDHQQDEPLDITIARADLLRLPMRRDTGQ